jgi:hypothetical protein
MNKQPHNTFRRLMIVASKDREPRPQPSGAWWWDPEPLHRPRPAQATPAAPEPIRMAVMLAPSRRQAWLAARTRIWNFLRAIFLVGETGQRGAAVLSFRRCQRHAAQARGVRRVAAEECVASKKPNSSVPWSGYRATARQEGGRG